MTDSSKKKTILVVEDESIIGMEIRSRLLNLGYEVPDFVRTGQDAIAQAEALQPDLVLMDIFLKGSMDGVEAATEIKSRLQIPVIYLTANTDEQTFQRAKVTQPFGYLLKPFEERELHTSIEMAFYKAGVEKELQGYREHLEKSLEEREKLIAQLQEALAKVKTLSGLLPICAACKKIRDDQGDWSQIETYIRDHSEAEFTHLVCPDCARRLYPDIKLYPDEETSSPKKRKR
ncbi:MAG: response regulator [Desulfobulbaceae bacterium]|nr:response regulator [Desulfobulbaceae bacterium]